MRLNFHSIVSGGRSQDLSERQWRPHCTDHHVLGCQSHNEAKETGKEWAQAVTDVLLHAVPEAAGIVQ